MSNRSLARKNRNRYKSIRCLENPRKIWAGLVEATAKLLAHLEAPDATRPFEIFGSCDHTRHVPTTVEQKEPLLCYTKTPTRLECVTMDLEK